MRTVGNVTISRLYMLTRDHHYVGWLMRAAGQGKVTITKQPLDPEENPYGDPLVYTGTLKRCSPPEHDSNSSDAAIIELELSTVTFSKTSD
jgi:hypothetical protein